MQTAPKEKFKTVEEYINTFSGVVKEKLETLRTIVRQAAPQAEEVISYNMPAAKWNGVLVYYAGNKNHIGFYPTASPLQVFKDELANYKTSKGAIQFPLDQAIPATLVKKIVRFRIAENKAKTRTKSKTVK